MSRRYGPQGLAMSELTEMMDPQLAADLDQLEEDWMDAVYDRIPALHRTIRSLQDDRRMLRSAAKDWPARLLDAIRVAEQALEQQDDHRPNEAAQDGEPYCTGCEVGAKLDALRDAVEDYVLFRGGRYSEAAHCDCREKGSAMTMAFGVIHLVDCEWWLQELRR